ncbi:ComEC/Rec2 family competence protein [Candidatus Microgenomates bacterium]|nr:ComEC/Rec2 family competence protein [Candidatus Microgenomates bacterium]
MKQLQNRSPVFLAILLYILFYFLRYQQGGWEIKLDLFPEFRQSLDQAISRFLPTPQAELLSGILLGNKKDLPYDLKLALRDSSTLHIVVVSGQNLTMLAGLFINLSGLIKRKTAIFISIGAIIFYTLLTGGQIPVLRAAIMASLAFTAQLLGRQRDGVWLLTVAAGLMLLINPKWIQDLSFQLSFLATLGVIVIAPILERAVKFLPNFVKQDLAITSGAQLMVIPMIAQNFHQFSLVSVFANLLVGWTIPIMMVVGTMMILVGSLWVMLGQLVGFVVNIFLTYFIYIVKFFASLPFAWEYVGEQVWIVWVGYYLLLGGVLIVINMLSLNNDQTTNPGKP